MMGISGFQRGHAVIWLLLTMLAACTAGPDLPPATSSSGPTPALLPISDVLRQAKDGPNAHLLTTTALENRANALRARAARLRGPVIASADQQMLRAAGAALR
ncbi:hypothetical protein [Roseinatronobacter alkalisoli]|uniref:Uncharacterized protein n=1 Tax=Roseinatronobacter alkalisoli TaxID=3028235 RepID=A0ABT5TDL7_9RHOB|nr:hypothetical protein [Roseinatronobacter sp. HJB301]MDD7972466.1 hypothetical protein [Roseinatronobacter sp. HJB301]